jgi:thiamine kinase-like enzyme
MAIGKFGRQWQCDTSTSPWPLLTNEGIEKPNKGSPIRFSDEPEKVPSGLKRSQSKTFLYARMPHDGKRLICLQQSIAWLAWLLFLEHDPLNPRVRPHSTGRWPGVNVKGIRSYLGFIKSNLRFLVVFSRYKCQRGKNEGLVTLPCYGQVCLPVHRGYKVFDWYRKAVIKVFDPDVTPSRIQGEIDLLQQTSKFDFAPSLKKWNVEERWYEEELFHGSLDSSGEPPDSKTLLSQFRDHVVHRLKALILFQEPKTANAVTYGTGMTNRLTDSRLARQESTVQECKRVAGFMDSIIGRIRREGDHPILLVFTHGDFVPANMLTTTQGMKIIDWEGAGYRSALYDFYSYFFNRSGSRNIPVSTLIAEVQKALPLFISELAKDAQEVALSARQGEHVYRWTFYIEMLGRLIEREMSDHNLNMLSYISRYLETFNRYEELLAGQSVVECAPQKAGLN